MKNKLTIAAVALGVAVAASTSQASLNFAGDNNAQFNGSASTFQLNPIAGSSATPQFSFTGSDLGLTGWITGAPWSVNMGSLSSTTVGSITYQQAPVTGGGQLNIFDGVNTLVANLVWNQMHTISDGQGGLANSTDVNLTGITYTGLNANLLSLAAGKNGNLNLTFQFSGTSPSLSTLFGSTAGTTTASYSGAISTATVQSVPEPSTVVAGLLLLLPFGVSTVRILRKHKQATN
ncbi:MAG TPA: hypothetical protein VL863_08370 [bacterium]|nr:hypothetical protein [bacterium]